MGNAPGQGPERLHLLRVPQLRFQFAQVRRVAKDHHDAVQLLGPAPDRGTQVGHRDIAAVPGEQDGLRRQIEHEALPQDPRHGTLQRLAGLLMHEPEHHLARLVEGILERPAGPRFRHRAFRLKIAESSSRSIACSGSEDPAAGHAPILHASAGDFLR